MIKKEERKMPVIHIYIPQYAHNIYLYKENIYFLECNQDLNNICLIINIYIMNMCRDIVKP